MQSIDRKLERLSKEIAEAKRKANPMTPKEFEAGNRVPEVKPPIEPQRRSIIPEHAREDVWEPVCSRLGRITEWRIRPA